MVLYTFHKKSKDLADTLCKYINKQFTMLRKYPVVVVENKKTKWEYDNWQLVTDDYCKQYSKDIEKIQAACNDFSAGYSIAKKGETVDFEKRFAEAILEAQDIREESYDQKAAEAVLGEDILTDFSKFYRKSYYEAANEAVEKVGLDKSLAQPIYLLNKYCWNDVQWWAEKRR